MTAKYSNRNAEALTATAKKSAEKFVGSKNLCTFVLPRRCNRTAKYIDLRIRRIPAMLSLWIAASWPMKGVRLSFIHTLTNCF